MFIKCKNTHGQIVFLNPNHISYLYFDKEGTVLHIVYNFSVFVDVDPFYIDFVLTTLENRGIVAMEGDND